MKLTTAIFEEVLGIKLPEIKNINGISLDSRSINKDDVFIGIKGQRVDGNLFAKEALENGAAFCIIDNEKYIQNDKTILVNNSLDFLKSLGTYIKNKANLKRTIAITGSVGKTTTRNWLDFILKKHFNSFSSIKNYNTIYGLPISLSIMPENTEYGIFELGTNKTGEILELSEYLNPDIGIITNIYESHIGNFKNKLELSEEKISIIDGMKKDGILIYDGDSDFKELIKTKTLLRNIKAISVGFSSDCDFCIKDYNKNVAIKTHFGNVEYNIAAEGKHFAYISAIVVAVLSVLNCDINKFLPYFSDLEALSGRGKILEFEYNNKKIQVIDDSYNASPSALMASIEVLKNKNNKHKIAVIGQMKELGETETFYHNIIAEKLAQANLDFVFFIGDKSLWNLFFQSLGEKVECFEEINDFNIEKILKMIENMGIVLLKGSRSIGLDKFIEYLNKDVL